MAPCNDGRRLDSRLGCGSFVGFGFSGVAMCSLNFDAMIGRQRGAGECRLPWQHPVLKEKQKRAPDNAWVCVPYTSICRSGRLWLASCWLVAAGKHQQSHQDWHTLASVRSGLGTGVCSNSPHRAAICCASISLSVAGVVELVDASVRVRVVERFRSLRGRAGTRYWPFVM